MKRRLIAAGIALAAMTTAHAEDPNLPHNRVYRAYQLNLMVLSCHDSGYTSTADLDRDFSAVATIEKKAKADNPAIDLNKLLTLAHERNRRVYGGRFADSFCEPALGQLLGMTGASQ
jgi:hypothetical protein